METINDLTQSAVVRVVAAHACEEIMKAIADKSMTTASPRRSAKSYGRLASTLSAASWWTLPSARSSS